MIKSTSAVPLLRRIAAARMARFASVLGLILLLFQPAASFAAGSGVEWQKAGQDSFTDLPGVKPQDPQLFGDGYRCETFTAAPRRIDARELRNSLPRTIYRCEKNGIIYQGTQPPTSGRGWYPGVNPRNLD